MLPTTKDHPIAGATPEAEAPSNAAGSSTGSGQMPRRTDAVGAEIPVMVHASRYSSAGFGVGKNLPPVHEETKTVIVFPDGAVVRISASIAAGETVVLTNQLTGADVICRVANVKTQPGIQNYVNLEFTQRAPGFWDGNSAPQGSSRLESIAPVSMALPDAVLDARTEAREITPAPAPMPAPRASAPKPILAAPPAAAAIPAVKAPPSPSPTPAPAVTAPEKKPSAVVMSGSLLGSGPGLNSASRPHSSAADASQLQSWARPNDAGIKISSEDSGSKKNLIIAVAAILLLVLGVAGGGLVYRHRSTGAASQAEGKPSEQGVPLPPVTTDQDASSSSLQPQNAAAESGSLQPAVVASSANGQPDVPATEPATVKSSPGTSRAAASAAQPSLQPNAQPRSTPEAESTRRPSVALGKLAAPVKPRAGRDSFEAAPLIVTPQSNGVMDSSTLGGDLAGPSSAAATSAVSSGFSSANSSSGTPRVGGQIQAPKLLSSPAPFYPPSARSQHIEGNVVVDATVDVTGKVIATKVISGPVELQRAATDAVHSWKYQAGRLDGLAIVTHTEVTLTFRIQ